MKLDNILLPETASIRDALVSIEANAGALILVVNPERQLVGAVSDGDIRRGLLEGLTLESPVQQVMNPNPVSVGVDTGEEEIFSLMTERTLRHIPITDQQGRVVDMKSLQQMMKVTTRDNWVVIMAGGLGTRLRPLTRETPKPMLEVGGRPILESTLVRCARAGYRRIFLSVNYHADIIKTHFGDGQQFGLHIDYLEENDALGTAGALGLLPEKPEHPLLVMNGDILTNLNLSNLFDFHQRHNSPATMGVREYEIQIPYGVVDTDANGITRLREKPYQQHYVNAGIYVLSPEAVARIPAGQRYDMPGLFQELMDEGRSVFAYPIHEYWLDIGHMSDYMRANMDFSEVL